MKVSARPNGGVNTDAVARVLAGLDQSQTLAALAWLHRRQASLAVMRGLLEARLAQLSAAPVAPPVERYLTVPEVAARLRLKRARVYELVRAGALPKLAGMGKQVRVPASALNGNHKAP